MHYREQMRAVVDQYCNEPISRRTLTESERKDHVIAEIQTLTARELGFESYQDLKNSVGIPTTSVHDINHTRAQVERRAR